MLEPLGLLVDLDDESLFRKFASLKQNSKKGVLLGPRFCSNCCKKPLVLRIPHFLLTRNFKKSHRKDQIFVYSEKCFSKGMKSPVLPIFKLINGRNIVIF